MTPIDPDSGLLARFPTPSSFRATKLEHQVSALAESVFHTFPSDPERTTLLNLLLVVQTQLHKVQEVFGKR